MSQKIINEIKLGFQDVLIQPKRSSLKSRKEVSLERTFKFKRANETWTGVPIIAANMDTVGTFEIAYELSKFKMLTAIHKHYSVEEWKCYIEKINDKKNFLNHIMVSSGTSEEDFKKLNSILDIYDIKFICIDIANGYSSHFGEYIAKVRKNYPNKIILAGNVVTADMTYDLLEKGADIIKVGIGPGSVCTTRKQTGVGYPQLSAVIECSDAAHGISGFICSDGGCTCPGDVSKAFGGDSDFVMIGGLFAGHNESGGEKIEVEGNTYIEYYGMSSNTAMKKHSGGVANYRSSEGKTVLIPYRGFIKDTVLDLLGGIRSTCTYIGAKEIKEIGKCTTFIRTNEQLNNIFGKN